MPVFTAEPDAMRQMASALIARADAIDALKVAAEIAVASGYSGALVAATLLEAETWSRGWAAALGERASTLDRNDDWAGVSTFTTWEAASALVSDRTAALTAPSALVASARDAAGSTPGALVRFLSERSPGEQDRIVAADPGLIATAAWVPLELRFAANRRLLQTLREDLATRRDALWAAGAGENPGPGEYSVRTAMAHRLEEELSAVDRLLAPGRRFLLVDWEGDGRIVEWVGPADAEHVAFLVPGMGAEKLRMDGLARLAGRMIRHDPTDGDLAVVTTLAYDAPDWLGSAALGSAADDGATALSEVIAGLPEDRHLTLVGHSYGSVVVARALLQRCGERVGDVVVLGSPGLGVDHVSELPIPADRLWVGRTPGDEIGAALDARGLAQVVRCLPPLGGGPFPVSRCDPPTSLVHGTDPAGDGFGALQFDAGVPDGVGGLAHNRYWAVTVDAEGHETPSDALRNLLLIATGQRGRVGRRRRRPETHPILRVFSTGSEAQR